MPCPPNAIPRTLMLLDGVVTQIPAELVTEGEERSMLVAASSRVQLALAPLLMPKARLIWTDFRCTASVRSLRAAAEGGGGLDRLIHIGGGEDEASGFAYLSTILTLLPALRRAQGAEILLCLADSPATRSVSAFLDRLQPVLTEADISVRWWKTAAA